MLANANTDANTNFFIQCSWEVPKWRSKFMVPLVKTSTVLVGGCVPGSRVNDTTASRCGMGRIIERHAPADKRSCARNPGELREVAPGDLGRRVWRQVLG